MKTSLKPLKKISPAYTLQVLAVIMLFGYAIASPKKESVTTDNDKIDFKIDKQLMLRASQYPLLNEKINDVKRYMVKRW